MNSTIAVPTPIYIALGSNQGDRLQYLQGAVDHIFKKIGQVTCVSAIYETPSWGFDGNDFFNACITVETRFSPEIVLAKLMDIEQSFGRERRGKGYHNRTLDLDLIFYGNTVLNTEKLILPHPRISERLFVLQPLADIAANFIHPAYQKTVQELLAQTQDPSTIKRSSAKLTRPQIHFNQLSYLAIEGNIGAGKTSLATMIAQDFNAKLITERYKDNPFLPKFYKNQTRYAFPLEMSFLADRYQQLLDDIGQYDLFNDFVVADYDIYKSLIFAGVTLSEEEYNLYKKLFQIMYKNLAKPTLYIYLYQNTHRLLQNIEKRGRSYEQNIPADYLENINHGYLHFIKTQNKLNTQVIDVSTLDFVTHREDYLFLIQKINAACAGLNV